MSFATVQGALAADVADGATFTAPYPAGFAKGDFTGGTDHQLAVGSNTLLKAPAGFGLAFNANDITVTNRSGRALAGLSSYILQLDTAGAYDMPGLSRVRHMNLVRVDLGNPIATTAVNLRAAAAVAGAGAIALLISNLDVPRNVIITSVGNDAGVTFTVTGKDIYGATVVEAITGANAGVAAGKKAFKSITSIASSGASAGNVSIGVGNVLGLPIFVGLAQYILVQLVDEANAAAGTLVVGLAPNTKSTSTTADVRGTMVPASAPDGSKSYALVVACPDATAKGSAQFAG